MTILRTCYSTKPVSANKVYQDYIADKGHVHMNATRWATLTEFCKSISREGLISIEGSDDRNGVMIQYIDRSINTILENEAKEKKNKSVMDDETYQSKYMSDQIKLANSLKNQNHQEKEINPVQIDSNSNAKLSGNYNKRWAGPGVFPEDLMTNRAELSFY